MNTPDTQHQTESVPRIKRGIVSRLLIATGLTVVAWFATFMLLDAINSQLPYIFNIPLLLLPFILWALFFYRFQWRTLARPPDNTDSPAEHTPMPPAQPVVAVSLPVQTPSTERSRQNTFLSSLTIVGAIALLTLLGAYVFILTVIRVEPDFGYVLPAFVLVELLVFSPLMARSRRPVRMFAVGSLTLVAVLFVGTIWLDALRPGEANERWQYLLSWTDTSIDDCRKKTTQRSWETCIIRTAKTEVDVDTCRNQWPGIDPLVSGSPNIGESVCVSILASVRQDPTACATELHLTPVLHMDKELEFMTEGCLRRMRVRQTGTFRSDGCMALVKESQVRSCLDFLATWFGYRGGSKEMAHLCSQYPGLVPYICQPNTE